MYRFAEFAAYFILLTTAACSAPPTKPPPSLPIPHADPYLGVAFEENLLRWKLLSEQDGIRLYRDPNSPLGKIQLRALLKVGASIAKMATVLTELEERKIWMSGLVENRVIRPVSDFERIEYARMNAQYPYRFLDFIYQITFSILRNPRTLLVRMASVNDDSVPVPDASVRGQIINSYQFVKEIETEQCDLAMEMGIDANGGVPSWDSQNYVNNWFRRIVVNLKARAEDPKFKVSKRIQDYIKVHDL